MSDKSDACPRPMFLNFSKVGKKQLIQTLFKIYTAMNHSVSKVAKLIMSN